MTIKYCTPLLGYYFQGLGQSVDPFLGNSAAESEVNMKNIMSNDKLKSIVDWYKYEGNDIEWTRFGYKQAWFSELLDFGNLRLFKSYNTIVALIDINSGVFYELGKWTRTTSKQVTQFYNQYYRNFERVLVHVND